MTVPGLDDLARPAKTSGSKQCACGRTISANKQACQACATKPQGSIEILNVGAGDVKINFNTGDAGEVIRAKRMVSDMLRRGYALLVEIERNGEKRLERIKAFDEKTGEYIIADFDPLQAREADMEEDADHLRKEQDKVQPEPEMSAAAPPAPDITPRRGRPPKTQRVPMTGAKATAVGRTAGG